MRVEPTQAFGDEVRLRATVPGRRPARDVGERAALEVIRDKSLLRPGEFAILLSDDRDARRLVVVDPRSTILLTTWDYLRQLEEARRIQSADAVFLTARAAGRHPPTHDLFGAHPPEVRQAIRDVLRLADEPDAAS